METEKTDQPVPVDEWTKFVEMMAKCKKEEISPAIWKYVRKRAVTTSSKLTRFSAKLSSGACAVSGWACVAALIVLIVMSRGLEKMMNRQEVIAEAKPVQTELEEAMTTEAEQPDAELEEADDWFATVGATATTTVNWGALKNADNSKLRHVQSTITTSAKKIIWIGKKYVNVSITITVQEKKIYFEAESMGGFCFNLKELEYSEKDQDSLLIGNGLSLVVDQTAMRRLLNGNRRLRTLTEEEKREREDRHRR